MNNQLKQLILDDAHKGNFMRCPDDTNDWIIVGRVQLVEKLEARDCYTIRNYMYYINRNSGKCGYRRIDSDSYANEEFAITIDYRDAGGFVITIK